MDQIETWHDAPTFEAMEKRIKVLEDALRKIADMCSDRKRIVMIGVQAFGQVLRIARAALEHK